MNLVIRNFPNELHRELKVLAAQHSITLSGLIIRALEEYVNTPRKREEK